MSLSSKPVDALIYFLAAIDMRKYVDLLSFKVYTYITIYHFLSYFLRGQRTGSVLSKE